MSMLLLKGGHLNTEQSSDVLYSKEDGSHHWFHAERINTPFTLTAPVAHSPRLLHRTLPKVTP